MKNIDISMPSKTVSQIGGETLPPMFIDSCVYTRHRFNPNIEYRLVNPERGQSSSPSPPIPGKEHFKKIKPGKLLIYRGSES